MNRRNTVLDCLKGFAILLMVLGHSIQGLVGDFDRNIFFRVIYSFHMPLFMFVSGYVSYKTFDGSQQKLFKRFKSLMIPFFAWFIFGYLYTSIASVSTGGTPGNFIHLLWTLFKSPDNGLWFLWILFLNYVLLFLALKINSRKEEYWMLIFVVAFHIVMRYSPIHYLGMALLKWHVVFYLMGYLIHKYSEKIKPFLHGGGLLSCLLFPILVTYWTRVGEPPFYRDLEEWRWSIKITVLFIYEYAVPITGILACYFIFQQLGKLKPATIPFVYFGKISIEIYTTHFYLFAATSVFVSVAHSITAKIAITFFVVLASTITVQYLVKKSNRLSFLLYGKVYRKETTPIDI